MRSIQDASTSDFAALFDANTPEPTAANNNGTTVAPASSSTTAANGIIYSSSRHPLSPAIVARQEPQKHPGPVALTVTSSEDSASQQPPLKRQRRNSDEPASSDSQTIMFSNGKDTSGGRVPGLRDFSSAFANEPIPMTGREAQLDDVVKFLHQSFNGSLFFQ